MGKELCETHNLKESRQLLKPWIFRFTIDKPFGNFKLKGFSLLESLSIRADSSAGLGRKKLSSNFGMAHWKQIQFFFALIDLYSAGDTFAQAMWSIEQHPHTLPSEEFWRLDEGM